MSDSEKLRRDSLTAPVLGSVPWILQKLGVTNDGLTAKSANLDSDKQVNVLEAKNFGKNVCIARAQRVGNNMRRLEPGEDGTVDAEGHRIVGERYPLWSTGDVLGLSQYSDWFGNAWLGEFGLGVSLYFSTLQLVGILLFILGCVNLNVAAYFASDDYSGGLQEKHDVPLNAFPISVAGAWEIPNGYKGTAWCPSKKDDLDGWDYGEGDTRELKYAYKAAVEAGNKDTVSKMDCPFNSTQAYADLFTTIIFFLFIMALEKVQGEVAEAIDEAMQTAQDYTIEVEDPGDDDKDPWEWKEFFESKFGNVTAVTVGVKNGRLIKILGERKAIIRSLNMIGWDNPDDDDFIRDEAREQLIKGEKLDESLLPSVEGWQQTLQVAVLGSSAKTCLKLDKINQEIKENCKGKVEQGGAVPARVYVTFELEQSQRDCLEVMSVGSLLALFDWEKPDVLIKDEHKNIDTKFKGNVLMVTQAPEPEDLLWENMDVEPIVVFALSLAWTALGACIVMVLSAIVIAFTFAGQPTLAAYTIALSNGMLPTLMKTINKFEPHPTVTQQQGSLLFKLVLARWTISAIVVYAVTMINDFESWNSQPKIAGIMNIMIADIFTSPISRFVIGQNLHQRFLLVAMAKSQEAANMCYLGAPWQLAERFSDMTKTLFICFFYSSLVPYAYFFAAAALFMNYWCDKYMLLRRWQYAPKVDASIVKTTRMHVALVLVVHCIITLHFFAGWPFDDINSETKYELNATQAMDVYGGKAANLTDCSASSCTGYNAADKEIWGKGLFIAFSVRGYFTSEMKTAVFMYQVLTIVMLCVIMVVYFGRSNFNELYKLFIGVPQDTTDVARRPSDPDKDYYMEGQEGQAIPSTASDVDWNAYIPELAVPGLQFTQLATRLPEWHKIVFKIQQPGNVDDAKAMISKELYVSPKKITITPQGDVEVETAGTAEAEIVTGKARGLPGLASDVQMLFNDVRPKTMDDPEELRQVAWFTEANLSWTANKHLTCLNLHGQAVPATYRQNSLYYDPILDEFPKHMLFSRCMVFRAPDRKDVEKMQELRKSEYMQSLGVPDAVPDAPTVEASGEAAVVDVGEINVEEGVSEVEMSAEPPLPPSGGIPDIPDAPPPAPTP